MVGRCDCLEIPKEDLMSRRVLNRSDIEGRSWRQPNSILRFFTSAINFDGAIRK